MRQKAVIVEGQLKKCKRCEIELPLDAFAPHANGMYGVNSKCRECMKVVQKLANDNDEHREKCRIKAIERYNRLKEENPDYHGKPIGRPRKRNVEVSCI
jgi:hypothetical protein